MSRQGDHTVAPVMTVSELIEQLADDLRIGRVPHAITEAREIIAALYDAPRFWPLLNGSVVVEPDIALRAWRAVGARRRGAPFAYAVGRAPFRRVALTVDERVLIPRPETEHLVDLVLDETIGVRGAVAVDVGTGSGAIAIALAAESDGRFSQVYAVDISRDAVDVARANVEAIRETAMPPVEVVEGALLAPLGERGVVPNVIVSNPPYIAFSEAADLPSSVRDWEPPSALYSGADGMAATKQLVREAALLLAPGGLLAMEVDVRRASLAAELVSAERRFESIRVELDLTGRERFVLARRTSDKEREP